ncbi:MAG TPA: hypothetical protein VN641_21465 [Urbifossiella sp.]|nr:hypothetical protein [Urbifossiella sp.]
MRVLSGALVLLLAASVAAAQPPFFEPVRNYYKARGAKVSAKWSVDRDTVPLDGALNATLTIRGAVNPRDIVRPELANVVDADGRHPYADRFQIEDVPGPPIAADAQAVSFVYRLRPRHRDIAKLPNLSFVYDTGKKFGDPFQTTVAKGPKLTITEAAAKSVVEAKTPLVAPEHLFHIESGPQLLLREPFSASPAEWWLLILGSIAIAAVWYAAWRRVYPEGRRLARLRRSRALRRATDAIRRANRSRDPAAAIAAAVLGYLQSRFPLPPGTETPGEVQAALRASPVPEDEIEAVAELLRRCDAARFAAFRDDPLSLAAEAETLLNRWEAVA